MSIRLFEIINLFGILNVEINSNIKQTALNGQVLLPKTYFHLSIYITVPYFCPTFGFVIQKGHKQFCVGGVEHFLSAQTNRHKFSRNSTRRHPTS